MAEIEDEESALYGAIISSQGSYQVEKLGTLGNNVSGRVRSEALSLGFIILFISEAISVLFRYLLH
jgi:hypothetical protein